MSQSDPEKNSVERVADFINELTPEQQEALRCKLNEQALGNQSQEACGDSSYAAHCIDGIGKQLSETFQHLVDRLGSGDIDKDIKKALCTAWQGLLESVESEAKSNDAGASASEDPQMQLEQAYDDALSNLIEVRQAVAQAIAAESLLKLQAQKNRDQATTWQNRADMAAQQNNGELQKQAMQRKQQYDKAAVDQENQLKSQRDLLTELRERFSKLEAELQAFYTKKQLLVARDKVAQATRRANELISRTSRKGASSVMERMEQKILENESRAASSAELSDSTPSMIQLDINSLLAKALTSIDRLTSVIERMEEKVSEHESQAGSGSHTSHPPTP